MRVISLYILKCLLPNCDAQMVLVPNALSWLMTVPPALVLAAGLRRKERLRRRLMAAGRVWTALDARRTEGRQHAERHIERLSGASATHAESQAFACGCCSTAVYENAKSNNMPRGFPWRTTDKWPWNA